MTTRAQHMRLGFPAGSQPVATSEDAADALHPETLSARRLHVLTMFRRVGVDGLTADEVVAACGGNVNRWAPRVTELRQAGCLTRGTARRMTRNGRLAFVHTITPIGIAQCMAAPHGIGEGGRTLCGNCGHLAHDYGQCTGRWSSGGPCQCNADRND